MSSNNPKNVHVPIEIIPIIKEMVAKINFPKKRIAIAVVIRIKDKLKNIFVGN